MCFCQFHTLSVFVFFQKSAYIYILIVYVRMWVCLSVDNEGRNDYSIHLLREEIHPSAAADLQACSVTGGCGARLLMPDLMAHTGWR